MRGHCRAPNRSVLRPTGMPPRSAAPATPRSDAASPRTRAVVVDRGPTQETQTGTRMSALEPRRDRSPRWHVHGCAGSLRWRPSAPDHVFGDGRLGDLEPELEQFAMNSRSAPQWILLAHPLDKFA